MTTRFQVKVERYVWKDKEKRREVIKKTKMTNCTLDLFQLKHLQITFVLVKIAEMSSSYKLCEKV